MDLTTAFKNEWTLLWFNFIKDKPNVSFYKISENITMDIVLDNMNKKFIHSNIKGKSVVHLNPINEKWDWRALSKNENVTMDIVKRFPKLPWDYWFMCYNPNMTMEMVLGFLLQKDVGWYALSSHPNVTMDMITNYIHKKWDWGEISKNPNITKEFIEKHELKLNHNDLCKNPAITMEMVESNKMMLHLHELSKNPNLTMDMVLKYYNKRNNLPCETFDWFYVSKCKNITMEMVLENLDLPWNFDGICENPNFTIDFLRNGFQLLLKKCNVECDFSGLNSWHTYWSNMSMNSTMTMDTILKHSDLPWNYEFVSKNPNLTIEFVLNNLDKQWNWSIISYNKMEFDKKNYIDAKIKWVLIVTMHKYYNEKAQRSGTTPYSLFESILFDSYLVKMLVKY